MVQLKKRLKMLKPELLKPGVLDETTKPKKTKSHNFNLNCHFYFNFDVLYPGQIIAGYVEISAEESCVVEQVIMEVSGTAECSWTFDKRLVKPPRIYKKGTLFNGKHQFYFSRHTLAGGNMGNVTIAYAGEMYPFKTSLPPHLPATWEGKYGTIKYIAKVLIKEPKKSLQTFTEEIKVYPKRNLKFEQHLLCEARQDLNRTFRYGVINLGNVYMSIWLPLCGVAAGQGIPLLCTIDNESTVQFGGLIFVLTQLQVYRSLNPTKATKTYRKDICRIPRMVDILQGKYEFYCVLETDNNLYPTNQFWKCKCCQVIYEVWASLQGAIPRYKAYGYPNIDTPGISIIIGTEPLCEWNNRLLTNDVMETLYDTRPPIIMEPLPPDDDIEEMLNNADEELDYETERNLSRQLVDESIFQMDDEDDNDTYEEIKPEDVDKHDSISPET